MTLEIHPSWEKPLQTEFDSTYFKQLINFIASEYKFKNCFLVKKSKNKFPLIQFYFTKNKRR